MHFEDIIRVLVIEDDEKTVNLVQRMLEAGQRSAFRVFSAGSLSEGLQKLNVGSFDVILLDLGLPDSRGMDALVAVLGRSPWIPVVVFTGLDDDEAAAEAIRKGAEDYLVKGQFDIQGLVRAIRHAIERHGQGDNEDLERVSQELVVSETRFRDMIESSIDGVVIAGEDGAVIYANPAAEKLLGRTARELAGSTFGVPLTAAASTEITIDRPGRGPAAVEVRVIPIDWEHRRAWFATLRDITENRAREETLRQLEDKLAVMFTSVSDGIFFTDLHGSVQEVNEAALRLFGHGAAGEVTGRSAYAFVHPDDRDGVKEGQKRTMKEGSSGPFEPRLVRKDGTIFHGEVKSTLLRDREGRPVGFVTSVKDVTEKKMAEQGLKSSLERLEKAMAGTIQAMAATVETRDPYTAGHQQRVAKLSCAIARELGWPDEKITGVLMAATIHDIGKIRVPAEILSKPGRLSTSEFALIKTHPRVGQDILKSVDLPWPVAEIIVQHHERLDGSGYPSGLRDKAICDEARVIAEADVVEAMASHRPYRPALGTDAALGEISRMRGKLFDPAATDACPRLFVDKRFEF
jgi:PAS domain S-box-containing protein/putative nucleotidyltransferase with HDIG domain